MSTYEARIDNKLDEIARTLDKLDDSLVKLQESDSRIKSFYEQQKAMMEIRSVLRKTDDIQELRVEQLEDGNIRLGRELTGEDIALDKINSTLTDLDDTLDAMNDGENKVKSFIEQKRALHDIKKILHAQGHYDHYTEDELNGITDIESML